MMHNMAMQKETFVWWDIKSCPIPDGFDPCLVGPRIESALRKSGYSGRVTITAAGNLRESPGEDVLRKLSSTGIALTHATEPTSVLCDWTRTNRSPATIMLIFGGPKDLELLADTIYYLRDAGYRILLAYHQQDPAWRWKSFLLNVSKEWLWKSLLSDDMDSGSADNKHKTTRLVLQDKYTERGKSPWYCRVCRFAGRSFEHFSTHLKSEKHAYHEWDLWASSKNVDRTNPDNLVWGRSKEWDLLNLEDMAYRQSMANRFLYNPLETTLTFGGESIKGKVQQEED